MASSGAAELFTPTGFFMSSVAISRRFFVIGAPLALSACATAPEAPPVVGRSAEEFAFEAMYGPIDDERFPIPALEPGVVDPRYLRQLVPYDTRYAPGTIVVDPNDRHLYLVRANGEALRYGVGVGREGFNWNGRARVARKAEWPTWTPPTDMIKRQPEVAKYARGMPGGLDNPLGARALYLFQGKHDTLYRIHGTNDPASIGHAMSSGCIRLINQDIIDLYRRAPVETPVVVLPRTRQDEPDYDEMIGVAAAPQGRIIR
jgi:lipoprotein-anchoring transpeptidase ErfK/SrfK